MPISINACDKPYYSWRFIATRLFMSAILSGLTIVLSACTSDRDLKRLVLGAWHCLSEPGVVRIFYVNNGYLEFGRAEPYARKERWKQDYIGAGKFRLQDSAMTLKYGIHLVKRNIEAHLGDEKETLSHFKIQEISSRILFLKPYKRGISKERDSSLFCKRVSGIEFVKFISYLQKKRGERAQRLRDIVKQGRLLHKVMRKKKRLIRRLNSVLCHHLKVNIVWLLNKLEKVSQVMPKQFLIQKIRQNGEFFEIKIEYSKNAVQQGIIKILRESDQIHIQRVQSYTLNEKLYFTVLFRRNQKAKQCLSFVSLPVSPGWISHHKLQLKQLQSLDVNYVVALRRNRIEPSVDKIRKSLRYIDKIFGHKSKSAGQFGLKWKKVKSSSTDYKLLHISSYRRIKSLLTALLSNKFYGEIVALDIIRAGRRTTRDNSEFAGKLVRLNITIKVFKYKARGLLNEERKVQGKIKASLLNVIYPKKALSEVPVINLF